jgi:NADPH:quinone reductase-like Zn-dependent oxidoreductase
MKAARVLRFGPPGVIMNDDLPRPEPAAGQLLVHVKAAGVGNWDALVREGKIPNEPLPLILGYELSGIVEAIGPGVSGFSSGEEVYGATSEQLTGAYAEYSVPSAKMSGRHLGWCPTPRLHRSHRQSGFSDALRSAVGPTREVVVAGSRRCSAWCRSDPRRRCWKSTKG